MFRLNTFALGSFYLIAATGILNHNSTAVAERTAGCGSGSSAYLLEIFSPVSSNQFRVACDEHDDCYDTLGKSRQECDNAFHNRMLGICARDHNTLLGKPLKAQCNKRADLFYAGVKKGGGEAYGKAQASARARSESVIANSTPLKSLSIRINTPVGVKCLDAAGETWSTERGTLQLYACNGTPNQQWEHNNGQLSLNTPIGVKCLDAAGETWSTERGTLQLYACNGTPNQQWEHNNGQLSLNTPIGVKCLDAAGETWSTEQGTLQLYACNGTPNQQWELNQ
jgi:hypothetical protein